MRRDGDGGERPAETYVLHQSDSNVFYESQDTRQAMEESVAELFADESGTSLRYSVVMKDAEALRVLIVGKNVNADFAALLDGRL